MKEASFLEEEQRLERRLIILGDQNLIALNKANFCNLETTRSQPLRQACCELYDFVD